MRSRELVLAVAVALIVAACAAPTASRLPERPRVGFGQPISEADLAAWNIDVRTPDGLGLPPGRGTVAQGKAVYEAKRSEEHTSELQSLAYLVCRLLLEKKKKTSHNSTRRY